MLVASRIQGKFYCDAAVYERSKEIFDQQRMKISAGIQALLEYLNSLPQDERAMILGQMPRQSISPSAPDDSDDGPAPIPITRPKPPSLPGVITADKMGLAASHDRDAERAARRKPGKGKK